MKRGRRLVKLLAGLLCVCLLFTSCAPAEISDEKSTYSEYSQQVQNLEKLCLVWGYTKYHHPAFLFGEKDWDEELLKLIPVVSEAKEDEVNDILHKWFASLGEIDYRTVNRVPQWVAAKEEDKSVQADTSWISEDYFGKELTEDLSCFGAIPNIDRRKAPVVFEQSGVPNFLNEPIYSDFNESRTDNRLLTLFRIWNALEYYYPYLNLLGDHWNNLLPEMILQVLQVQDQHEFQKVLEEIICTLQDGHVKFLDDDFFDDEFGKYTAPVQLVKAEGKYVVFHVLEKECPLQIGDVILELDGQEIQEVANQRKQYCTLADKDRSTKNLVPYLLRSQNPQMKITVLRDGSQLTLQVKGSTEDVTIGIWEADVPYQIMQGNIGLINPFQMPADRLFDAMEKLKNTNGLIIDMRQYPANSEQLNFASVLLAYIQDSFRPFAQLNLPSQAVPGTFVRQVISNNAQAGLLKNYDIYHYNKPVVVMMGETSKSQAETVILALKQSSVVTTIGETSNGSNGDVVELPLPNGQLLAFSSVGVSDAAGEQTQIVGIKPDIEVHPTIEGIKEGKDELKEAAVAYIQEQNAK